MRTATEVSPFPQHFGGEEDDLLRRAGGRLGGAAFGAATADGALLAPERAEALVADPGQADADQGQDKEMLEPDGHGDQWKNWATATCAPGFETGSIDSPELAIF